MSDEKYHVLILDDDYAVGELLSEYLQNTGCAVTYVTSEPDFWESLSTRTFDILFLDYKLQNTTGLDILGRMGQAGVNIPTVMMTGEGNENIAARAIQSGALDYLVKGEYSLSVLPSLIQKAVRLREMQKAMQRYLEQIRYQAMLLDNMRDAVVVWGLDGRITYWNAAAEQLYGVPASEQFGRPVCEVYFPAFDPPISQLDLNEAGSLQIEHRFQKPSGERIWISAHITTLYGESDPAKPVGYMNVARDITDSKLAEEKLMKSEARYRAIVDEHQTEMICRFLPDHTLTFVNEAYCRYYLKERSELVGASFLDPVLDEEKEAVRARLAALSDSAPVTTYEQRVRLAGGETRWQEWVSRAIFDVRGEFLEFQAIGRDITERKQMEAQLQSAQYHLAQAARLSSIGELASGVAHQISNPLTTIIADAQILSHQLGKHHPGQESARAIIEAGWRAQRVINELMKFAQPSQVTQEPVSVNETIEKALLLASAHIQAYGIQLQAILHPDLPPIRANTRQLTDLWVTLLLLARSAFHEHEGEGQRIQVISGFQYPNKIVVEVRDNGTPIPAEQYDTIFEPQLIPTGSGRGTGMELSLCREIVRQNHGQIHISGNSSETVFRILFSTEGT